MKTTKTTDANGITTQTNYVVDEVIETYNDHWNQKDELIRKLAIQKFQYGRDCMGQLMAKGGQTLQQITSIFNEMDAQLKSKIIELENYDLKQHNKELEVGDRAFKPNGYKFPCVIVAKFTTTTGEVR